MCTEEALVPGREMPSGYSYVLNAVATKSWSQCMLWFFVWWVGWVFFNLVSRFYLNVILDIKKVLTNRLSYWVCISIPGWI